MLVVLAIVVVAMVLALPADDPDPKTPRAAAPAQRQHRVGDPDRTTPLTRAPARLQRLVVGRGARSAVVIRIRAAGPQPAVIFLHGWRLVGRDAYRAWFTHLARRGATVIAPRYQLRSTTATDKALDNALAGVRAALQRVPVRTDSVTVAGHSAGGALAADYAAVAAREGLPRARSVLAIYPGRALRDSAGIPPADLSQIPAATRLIAMASPADQVVGDRPARELVAAATAIAPASRRLIAVTQPDADHHYAPLSNTATARRIFWRQLDRLVAPDGKAR